MKPKDNIAPIRDLLKPISANDLFDFDFLFCVRRMIFWTYIVEIC